MHFFNLLHFFKLPLLPYISCTEATPAHNVSSGEDDDESQESEKTRIASPDELVGDSAKAAETKEEKHGEKKKKKENTQPQQDKDSKAVQVQDEVAQQY